MDAYWSIEVCGWVASPGTPDALSTPWSLPAEQTAERAPDLHPPLPAQRSHTGALTGA
jgi:hypothetical protein